MRPQPRNDVVSVPIAVLRRLIAWLVIAAVVVGIGSLAWQQRDRFFVASAPQVDKNAYQAVFLLTNQVYFGKMQIDGDNYLLTDVFYLSQPVDPNAKGQLVKRGNELHGPREPMIIPARSVLFIENMRDDAEVVVAIKAFKSGQTAPASAAPVAPVATTAPAATGSPRPSPTR